MRLATLFLSCAVPATAQDFSLALPIDCALGDTCYIQNYVDHDPSEAASDFLCGTLTYDSHNGTDFGLPTLAAMMDGVDVLAASSGTVRGVRNDMRDVLYTPELAGEINGRDCGNGVVIAHEGGWETQYCHMKEGSVQVLTGDYVETGDVLGQVGLSGRTQFPHVHIAVRRDGRVIDPFDPDNTVTCDAPSRDTLWNTSMATPQLGLLAVGFSDSVPEYNDVKAGSAAVQSLVPNAPVVLWALAFGSRPGDVIRLQIHGPDGPLFETDDVLDRQQAIFMRAGGLNVPDGGWPSGRYDGTVSLMRGGVEIDSRAVSIALP